jgi:hypothetical protein
MPYFPYLAFKVALNPMSAFATALLLNKRPKSCRMLPSPLNQICTLDTSYSVCTGCGRTLGEIAEWKRDRQPSA